MLWFILEMFIVNWSLLVWCENVFKCSESVCKERDNYYYCVNNICILYVFVFKFMCMCSLKINIVCVYNGSWICLSWYGCEF